MEVTRVIKVQSNCRECLDLIVKALSMFNGILLMKFFGNDLVITYDTNNINFSDIAQSILSLGVGLILRKVIMNASIRGNINFEELELTISRSVDGIVSLFYDQATSRLSIIMHPDTDINTVINNLVNMGITINEVTTDELTQVLMARS
ncbi:hypothetical protein [Vulcanisaeta distributa]|uniref:Uncharacterized protein n=1 Tax=Vulcanisaeta distributa (strain DSM 14429 / JCM 11212 / NBRC 100878 / IC-017) TaxID=572478 RepID=E1QT00_VULDI|nr:hypothetical protein [Vulcanisaeta distributa]ADN50867.1 hypothetical protein Vdis_1481 [Vulcanisaeta distributa DSM 14429]